jgi:hypothetical protein
LTSAAFFSASCQLAFAESTAPSASARLCRSWTSAVAVYVAPPNVNDPFGECFCVPATSPRIRCSNVAFVTFAELMIKFLLSEDETVPVTEHHAPAS